jgi:hypothetical protein
MTKIAKALLQLMLRKAKMRIEIDGQERPGKPVFFTTADTEMTQRYTENSSVKRCGSSVSAVVKEAVHTGRSCVKAIAQFLAA